MKASTFIWILSFSFLSAVGCAKLSETTHSEAELLADLADLDVKEKSLTNVGLSIDHKIKVSGGIYHESFRWKKDLQEVSSKSKTSIGSQEMISLMESYENKVEEINRKFGKSHKLKMNDGSIEERESFSEKVSIDSKLNLIKESLRRLRSGDYSIFEIQIERKTVLN